MHKMYPTESLDLLTRLVRIMGGRVVRERVNGLRTLTLHAPAGYAWRDTRAVSHSVQWVRTFAADRRVSLLELFDFVEAGVVRHHTGA